MNESAKDIEWPPPGWRFVNDELHISGSGNGYDEAIKIPASKMDEFRALLESGMPLDQAVRVCSVIAFVWHDWDSPFYN